MAEVKKEEQDMENKDSKNWNKLKTDGVKLKRPPYALTSCKSEDMPRRLLGYEETLALTIKEN